MRLSVIIVNYNVKYFLEQCLYSVIKASSNIETEIFVIDNHSTDGSKEYMSNRFPSVQFIWQQSNPGFGKANNSVLKKVSGEYVLFLNPDTIVAEDCFEKCLSFFSATENCGALGVKMLDGTGKFLKESKRSFPSPVTSFCKLAGLSALFPRSKLFAKYYAGHLPADQNNEVDVLAGAFMMLDKKTLDKVKGFDEDFFMYGEDIDLSYRIQQSGLKNYYFSETAIIHFKGESTQKQSYNFIRQFYEAMTMFVSKHYKEKKIIFYSMKAAIGLSRLLATVVLFFKRSIRITTVKNASGNSAVMASQHDFDKIIHLVRHSEKSIVIKGRIAIDKNDNGISLAHIDDIEGAIKKYNLSQLIFCEGEISFKLIIMLAEQLQGKLNFLFHAKSSKSIVGSNSKNHKGFFIAEP